MLNIIKTFKITLSTLRGMESLSGSVPSFIERSLSKISYYNYFLLQMVLLWPGLNKTLTIFNSQSFLLCVFCVLFTVWRFVHKVVRDLDARVNAGLPNFACHTRSTSRHHLLWNMQAWTLAGELNVNIAIGK